MPQREQRERDITVRALRAERVVAEEILRDETQPEKHKDDTFWEAELIDSMLIELGACPAVAAVPQGDDPTDVSDETPIRFCTRPYHEEGDHTWF